MGVRGGVSVGSVGSVAIPGSDSKTMIGESQHESEYEEQHERASGCHQSIR